MINEKKGKKLFILFLAHVTVIWNKHTCNFVLNDRRKPFFNMVDFTTAIIFQYMNVYFILQKAKSFAITYFEIRKPFNLKIWKQKSVQFGFMIRPLINPLNICWTFGINTLIHLLHYFKSPLFDPDHTLLFNRMKRPKSKLECDLFFNLISIGFENQKYF